MKEKIIHLLGGYTEEELLFSQKREFLFGMMSMSFSFKNFAEEMNGQDADSWCKRMYNYICEQYITTYRLHKEISDKNNKDGKKVSD